jgi:hypothetical protein
MLLCKYIFQLCPLWHSSLFQDEKNNSYLISRVSLGITFYFISNRKPKKRRGRNKRRKRGEGGGIGEEEEEGGGGAE